MKIPRFTAQMKEILVKGGQLTDEHIHLAQQLLKKQFPHLEMAYSQLYYPRQMALRHCNMRESRYTIFVTRALGDFK